MRDLLGNIESILELLRLLKLERVMKGIVKVGINGDRKGGGSMSLHPEVMANIIYSRAIAQLAKLNICSFILLNILIGSAMVWSGRTGKHAALAIVVVISVAVIWLVYHCYVKACHLINDVALALTNNGVVNVPMTLYETPYMANLA